MEDRKTDNQMDKYVLRKASLEDAFCLFNWKNDPENLKNSHSHNPVVWEDHMNWLEMLLKNPDRILWVLEEEGTPVGQLRFDIQLVKLRQRYWKQAEISYSVASQSRGKGIGKYLLQMAEMEAKRLEIDLLYGEVLAHNEASRKLFQSLKYVEKREESFYSYKKCLNTVFIRTDMNETIATGHVMRCLSIADAAAKNGSKVVFISADQNPEEIVRLKGYEFFSLKTRWDNMEGEIDVLIALLQELGVSRLLIDSYQVTDTYLSEVEKVTEIFYLDDLDQFEYPVQNVICYANYHSKLSYGNYGRETNFYLGTSYMPLREIYSGRQKKKIRKEISHVLLLSGGSDPLHMIDRILPVMIRKLEGKSEGKIMVICGKLYKDFEQLCIKYQNNESTSTLRFLQNVPNLEEYMEEADLAVSAGGTTLYELSAMGVPTITYSFADNQLRNVLQFMEDGLMDYAGDGREEGIEEKVGIYFDQLDSDFSLREERSKKMQQLVDGRGAKRIADLLLPAKECI